MECTAAIAPPRVDPWSPSVGAFLRWSRGCSLRAMTADEGDSRRLTDVSEGAFATVFALGAHRQRAPGERLPRELAARGSALVDRVAGGTVRDGSGRRFRLPLPRGGDGKRSRAELMGEEALQETRFRVLSRPEPILAAVLHAAGLEALQGATDLHAASAELLAQADLIVESYIATMLGNAFVSRARREEPEVEADCEEAGSARGAPPPEGATLDVDLAQARAQFDRVRAHALAGLSREDYRALFELGWEELNALYLRARTMAEVVEAERLRAGIDDRTEEDSRRRARDRVYKRHERVRKYLRGAIDALVSDRALTPAWAHALGMMIDEFLMRCQRRPKAAGAMGDEGDYDGR